MKLKTNVYNLNYETGQVLPVGTWISVYALYFLTHGGYGGSKVYVDGVDAVGLAATTTVPSPPPTFSTSDELKIGGGFEGYLRRFQIYSPAAFPFETASSSSTTNLCFFFF